MIKNGFEEFTARKGPSGSRRPRVGIQRSGKISLNRVAFEHLGEPSFVVLMFDRERQAIGLRAAKEDVPYAYSVNRQDPYDSYRISARAFLNHYGITYRDESLTFYPKMEGEILVINIEKEEDTNGEKTAAPTTEKVGVLDWS